MNPTPQMQQMMQFMNMMNMMKESTSSQPELIDPNKIDPRVRKNIINQNITQTQIGLYKKYPNFRPVLFELVQNFTPGVPTNICDVRVEYQHVLDVAEPYVEKGINFTSSNNMNPVILNVVGRDFTGTNFESSEEIRDQVINMRTSFNNTSGSNPPYPLKGSACVYTRSLTIIRGKNMVSGGFLPFPQTYRVAMITTTSTKSTTLLSQNRMNSHDYLTTLESIECVFQAAIAGKHPILILAPFGHDIDNNPISDIISIYNFCILKYGHRFKQIIIGVPPFYPKAVFETYNNNIIKPQNIVESVEEKYEQEELKNNLLNSKNNLQVLELESNQLKKNQVEQNKLDLNQLDPEIKKKIIQLVNQSN